MPNTYDTPLHYRLKNRNLLHAKFSHAFDSPDSARYVRLEFFNSRGRLDIQEIEVYDRMTKTRVNNEVDHGFTLPDPSFTASDIGISAETNFSKAKGAVFASIEAMPNPFNPNITIIVNGINAHAELSIISPNGTRVVKSTIASSVPFVWNATDKMAAGVYIVRIKTIHGILTKKVVLSK
jgi:hypothetical protein